MDDKLPIKKIFLNAMSLPSLYHRELIKIGWPLLLVGLILIILQHITVGGGAYTDIGIDAAIGATLAIAFSVTIVMAIVGCHRLFIFGPKKDCDYKVFEWTGNEIKYAGWWILIGFASCIISIPFMFMLIPFVQGGFDGIVESQTFLHVVIGLINIPIYYFIARWSLVLPASATNNHGKSLSWSWALSSSNGWRLMLLIGFLPFFTDLLFDLLPDYQSIFIDLIAGFVWIVVGVVEIGLLSLSYSFIALHQTSDDV